MADGGYDLGCDGVLNQLSRSGNFRCDRDDFHKSIRRLEKLLKGCGGRPGDCVRRMHTSTRMADEWPLEVNPDELGCKPGILLNLVQLRLAANVVRNALQAVAGILDRRGDGGGDQRRGAVARDGRGDTVQR